MDARHVVDGWDVSTPLGTLHFLSRPSESDVATVLAAMQSPPPAADPVEAEDGTVV